MPELAATIPSRPFPTTAVDIAFESPSLLKTVIVFPKMPRPEFSRPAQKNAVKMFINEPFTACHGQRYAAVS
jgi:hypothetical protein